jgi:NAD(P)-dependent dehydrogenase (short-subunit alcohol dehydrogenase family)
MSFTDKYAVVTGGANGIGRCIAEKFLDAGAFVMVIDTDEQVSVELLGRYDRLFFFTGDIADRTTLERFVHKLVQPIDFIINNACVSRKGLLSNCS